MKVSGLSKIAVCFAVAFVCSVQAEVVLLEPAEGAVFKTLTDWQLKTFEGKTRQERLEILKGADEKATRKEWRRQRPLVLRWKSTDHEKYPWRIRLATKSDMSNARDFWVGKDDIKRNRHSSAESTWEYTVPLANLELGTTYYWQVWSNVKCSKFSCGFTYPDKCKCGKTKHGRISAVGTFATDSLPPRWIEIEGRVKNIRDLGGWVAEGGRKVRTGMIYRGQAFNDDSLVGLKKGRNRLMVEDVEYFTGTLGIKTDLDLRHDREVADMKGSPLGDGVRFVRRSSPEYGGIFKDDGAKTMAENFRVFCDRANYPIYIHCIAGADRTGSLVYVLNGILGVAKEDLERDWESTFYPELPGVEHPDNWRSMAHLDKGFAAYGAPGDTLQRRIELYLLGIGITPDEIKAFKSIMLGE